MEIGFRASTKPPKLTMTVKIILFAQLAAKELATSASVVDHQGRVPREHDLATKIDLRVESESPEGVKTDSLGKSECERQNGRHEVFVSRTEIILLEIFTLVPTCE